MKKSKTNIVIIVVLVLVILIIASLIIINKTSKLKELSYDEFVNSLKTKLINNNIEISENFIGEKIKNNLYRFKLKDEILMYIETSDNQKIYSINYIFGTNINNDEIQKNIQIISEIITEENKNITKNIIENLLQVEAKEEDGEKVNSFSMKGIYFIRFIDDEGTSIFINYK